ncbi:sigma factor [Nocardioides sp. YIM 152315]|uniref:sigma factor n=1 Tax=Nocardioides sp. YIM 152315 TaxID=3031760 RepID=UPI0023DC8004|nr:sigma factor [Nocardioides sp. YIM 152315]MDF1603999.1 sigma factor [Nocardioides sp. YIM 152315]
MSASADFDEFVAARSLRLLRTAYLLTRDHALAEDLLQTALSKAWFSWPRIQGDPEPYVRRILVNTFASWWRRRWNGEHAYADLPEPESWAGAPEGGWGGFPRSDEPQGPGGMDAGVLFAGDHTVELRLAGRTPRRGCWSTDRSSWAPRRSSARRAGGSPGARPG